MFRRHIPLALAGAALIPAMARAQAPMGSANPQAGTAPSRMAGMSPDQLALQTHEAGSFSLMTARIGVEKATNPDVKRFANFEVTEQEGVAQAMKLAGHNFPDHAPAGEKAQALQKLQAASGAEFDRMFLQVQEQGHQELLSLTTALMNSTAPAPDKITALLANGQIKEHLILIGQMMGRR